MTTNEIMFCEYFETTMLPNRNNVSTDMVRHAGGLIGHPVNLSCRSCLHNSAIDLLNMFNRMKPVYDQYKKDKEVKENDIHTKFEETILEQPEIIGDVKPEPIKIVKPVEKPVELKNEKIKNKK
jgi:hypothetical protein